MIASCQMVVLYLISGEDSRLGRTDYWNHVFISRMTPVMGNLLETLKILLIVVLSVIMAAAISQL